MCKSLISRAIRANARGGKFSLWLPLDNDELRWSIRYPLAAAVAADARAAVVAVLDAAPVGEGDDDIVVFCCDVPRWKSDRSMTVVA